MKEFPKKVPGILEGIRDGQMSEYNLTQGVLRVYTKEIREPAFLSAFEKGLKRRIKAHEKMSEQGQTTPEQDEDNNTDKNTLQNYKNGNPVEYHHIQILPSQVPSLKILAFNSEYETNSRH